ncbi:60S ribosomal protein L35a [Thelohanellus kitauei]|uniref:Large ribosomal subunit protein eL33 n=1 Tax=Thelohanellus kitauei TaxID=669202 RepID=A0A0C2MNP6_THEKT|nr:60S ribosomal protein L35a [Thelohanellus kitauei]
MNKQKPARLYSRAVFSGYRRSKCIQHEQQCLVKIEGVHSRDDAKWYVGKTVAYHYKGGKRKAVRSLDAKKKLKYRKLVGKVIALHGNTGTIRAKFPRTLPPQAIGKPLRVYLYPSLI